MKIISFKFLSAIYGGNINCKICLFGAFSKAFETAGLPFINAATFSSCFETANASILCHIGFNLAKISAMQNLTSCLNINNTTLLASCDHEIDEAVWRDENYVNLTNPIVPETSLNRQWSLIFSGKLSL